MTKIKKGDKVLVIAGKDKGKAGKVLKAPRFAKKVVVEGVNLIKKHVRSRREGEKGQVIQVAAAIDLSNLKLICPKCDRPARVGYKVLEGGRKIRICKKCGAEI
jgi:large subunit ribosomal protein L24